MFSAAVQGIVSTTKQLLGKAASSNVITGRGLEIVNPILQVFEALPSVVVGLDLQFQVTAPCRTYGSHEINHWWNIEIEDGSLGVTSGGYFYRPERGGGDAFTAMVWRDCPGSES